jgi:predicted PurR-regulated permease PerM
MVKRSIAIVLTYLGVVVALVLVAGLFAPLVVQEFRQLIDFIVSISQAGSLAEYLRACLVKVRVEPFCGF